MKKTGLLVFLCFLMLSAIANAQTSNKTVTARRGDGIISLLRRNGLDPGKYYKAFVNLNRKNISKKNGLYIGRRYILPVNDEKEVTDPKAKPDSLNQVKKVPEDTPDTTTIEKKEPVEIAPPKEKVPKPRIFKQPLFGKKLENVTIESDELKGAIYYLISGHGGPDPGALIKQGRKLVSEDEYAYDVNLRLARKLIAKGAKVYIIIQDPNDGIRDQRLLEVDYDEVNYPKKRIPRSQRLRLKQRTESVNALFLKNNNGKGYQRLIVTHVDSRSVGEVIDVFFYHHERSKKGKRLAESIQSTFKQKYARYQPNRKYSGTVASRSGLYVIRNTMPAMVYIELGNLKNTKDQKRILDYNNREALAKWISEGLIADFKKN